MVFCVLVYILSAKTYRHKRKEDRKSKKRKKEVVQKRGVTFKINKKKIKKKDNVMEKLTRYIK